MNEFLDICKPIIDQAIHLASRYANNKSTSRPIIAIAGGSGAGKSYFSKNLQQALQDAGYKALIINQNGFSPYNKDNSDALINIQPTSVHECMQKIKHATTELQIPIRTRAIHPYGPPHHAPHTISYETIHFKNIDLVLFEGALVLCATPPYDFFTYADFGIFIQASPEHMREWKTERELAKRPEYQRSAAELEKQLDKGSRVYQLYVAPTKKHATFVIYKKNKNTYTLIVQNPT